MSLELDLPSIFLSKDWWEAKIRSKQILNQKFATVLSDKDLSDAEAHLHKGFQIRPRMPASMKASGLSEVKIDKDWFEVSLDLDEFEVGEMSVKLIDRFVEVEGKHDKRDQYGLVSREFRRQYMVPHNCDIKALTSSLTPDYKLTIKAPLSRKEQRMFNHEIEVPVFESKLKPMVIEQIQENREKTGNVQDMPLETSVEAKPAGDHTEKDVKPEINLETEEDVKIIEDRVRETFHQFWVTASSPKAPASSPKAPASSPKAPASSPKAPASSPKAPASSPKAP